VRVAALGKKGSISALLSTLGKMSPDERKTQGAAINLAKDTVTQALTARRDILKSAALDARLASETIDVTLPVRDTPAEQGRIHPLSQVMDELTAIFADMGFAIAEGPDTRDRRLQFHKTEFSEGHPAREMHDTFFFNPKEDGSRMLLRTHTSPVQVRTMLTQKPPIRIICPGRTYRIDSDATHTPQFHQVEGLVIDKGSHLGHLKWILHEFCKAFLRGSITSTCDSGPRFFPFTEPGRSRVDIQCRRDKGEIPVRRRRGLAGDSGLRHGASERAARLRHRSRRLSGLCLGHGHRPHRDAEIRHVRPAAVVRKRRTLAQPLRLQAARCPDTGGRVEFVSDIVVRKPIGRCVRSRSATSPALADELLELVVKGVKTATCSTEDEPNISKPGERWIVLDGRGHPRCVIESTEITFRPFAEVDAGFAHDEGEGDRSLAYWRSAASHVFWTAGQVQRRHDVDVRTFPSGRGFADRRVAS